MNEPFFSASGSKGVGVMAAGGSLIESSGVGVEELGGSRMVVVVVLGVVTEMESSQSSKDEIVGERGSGAVKYSSILNSMLKSVVLLV